MNVRRTNGTFALQLDLAAIRALLADHYARDLGAVLERGDHAKVAHVVLGGRSDALDDGQRQELARLARVSESVHLRVLERSGHWLQVDDPGGLLQVFCRAFASLQ